MNIIHELIFINSKIENSLIIPSSVTAHNMSSQEQPKQTPKIQNIPFTSNVNVIGYYPPLKKTSLQTYSETIQFDPNSKTFIPHHLAQSLNKSNCMTIKVKVNPIVIAAQGNTIAMIDENHNAWVLSQIFQTPVNLSLLIKRRVTQIYVNQKQIILKTKKGLVLINWGAKKLFQNSSLVKIPVNDNKTFYQNFFQAFSILDGNTNDIFYMSNMKKSQNSNKMYRITSDGAQILGYPTLEKWCNFRAKITGISAGKYHSLCWDQNGGIYSWGTRTLGLGFDELPDQDLITEPTLLNFNFKVKTAYASNQYSLALSYEGDLYEWGVKKQVNEINEELIFQPRIFFFKYFNCLNKRFTTLKGKNQKFGVVCSNGNLFVWGQKARPFINPNASIPKQWQNGRLYEPFPVDSPPGQRIINFIIQQNYLSLITIPKQCKYQMKEESEYWNHIVTSVRTKFNLKKYRKMKTEDNLQNLNQNQEIRFSVIQQNSDEKQNNNSAAFFNNTISSYSNRFPQQDTNRHQLFMKTTRDDKISKAQQAKKSKDKYIKMSKNQQKLISYIMKPLKNQKMVGLIQRETPKKQYNNNNILIKSGIKFHSSFSDRRSFDQTRQTKQNFFQTLKKKLQIPQFLKNYQTDFKYEKIQQSNHKNRINSLKKPLSLTTSGPFTRQKSSHKNYQEKLKQVLEKKKLIESINFNQTMKKLQENSLEHRMKRHVQIKLLKQKQNNHQLLKNTICKFLIKNYIIKMVTAPLAKGRQIKIQNFARTLKFQRIEKNIRKIFVKAKVRFGLKKLQSKFFLRYALLIIEWRRYVKKFRQKKYQENKKFIVSQLTKYFIKDKLKLGLSTSNLNIRKIQKFRQWLVLVKNQRMKCLKYLWRIHLFSIMKINTDNQSVVVCHLPKNTEDLTFESLYTERVQQNPNLKLENFLNKSPLFKIKVEYFRTVANLFTEQKKPLHKSQKIINYLTNTKRTRIKFLDNEDDEKNEKEQSFKVNILSNQIYPYSIHYNIFIKPKNYDITISEVMKKSEKWIMEQKYSLQKILDKIIEKHQRNYLKKRREYDEELAKFIRAKYDYFSEKRWRYIIQYNQIEKNIAKKKREKELYRIMDLIGMLRILQQDCIPEKQVILEEAKNRKDAPKAPNNYIVFGQKEFREAFKLYFDDIHTKIKQIRKLPLN